MTTRYADDATLARIAELEAENAALALDAARYRFIRDVPYVDEVRVVMTRQLNATMDTVIDAAMGATP